MDYLALCYNYRFNTLLVNIPFLNTTRYAIPITDVFMHAFTKTLLECPVAAAHFDTDAAAAAAHMDTEDTVVAVDIEDVEKRIAAEEVEREEVIFPASGPAAAD